LGKKPDAAAPYADQTAPYPYPKKKVAAGQPKEGRWATAGSRIDGIVLCTTKLSLKKEKVSVPAYGMIINGEKVLSKDSFEVVNPATGGPLPSARKRPSIN
jgi:hypothetical protein